jgi:hypothetical protein
MFVLFFLEISVSCIVSEGGKRIQILQIDFQTYLADAVVSYALYVIVTGIRTKGQSCCMRRLL